MRNIEKDLLAIRNPKQIYFLGIPLWGNFNFLTCNLKPETCNLISTTALS